MLLCKPPTSLANLNFCIRSPRTRFSHVHCFTFLHLWSDSASEEPVAEDLVTKDSQAQTEPVGSQPGIEGLARCVSAFRRSEEAFQVPRPRALRSAEPVVGAPTVAKCFLSQGHPDFSERRRGCQIRVRGRRSLCLPATYPPAVHSLPQRKAIKSLGNEGTDHESVVGVSVSFRRVLPLQDNGLPTVLKDRGMLARSQGVAWGLEDLAQTVSARRHSKD